jgi:serine/threonine protein phosphatase PrpC
MEDTHIAEEIDLLNGTKGMLFCVFDGHGGKEVAVFAKEHYKNKLINDPDFKNGKYASALTKSFLTLDAEVKKEDYATDTGTTACVVLLTPDKIYCSNAGDSRGVLNRGG